jgi:hypothetical protein
MPDILTYSPEAVYGSKGNIIPQKAHYVNRALNGTAQSLAGTTGTAQANLPTAESVTEDHLPVAVTDAAFAARIPAATDTGA